MNCFMIIMDVKKTIKEELQKLRDSSVDKLYDEAQKKIDEAQKQVDKYEKMEFLGSAYVNYIEAKNRHNNIIADLKNKLILRMILRLSNKDDF